MRQAQSKGINLANVLTVAAFGIAVAVIVLPVVGQIKIGVIAAPCPVNMRAEIAAFQMYANDWDGKPVLTFFPGTNAVNSAAGAMCPGRQPTDAWKSCLNYGGSQVPGWGYLLEPYRHGYPNLRCDAGGDDFGVWGKGLVTNEWWLNWCRFAQHGYNWAYICPTRYPGTAPGEQFPMKLSQFANPPDTVVFVDSRLRVGDPSNPTWKRGYSVTDPPACAHCSDYGSILWLGGWNNVAPDPRHRGFANVAWMDGRVSPVTYDYLSNDSHWDFLAN